jgi:chromate transport protein ChrA
MISPEHPLASWFLLVSVTFFLLVYALPLLLMPLRWASWFGWKAQEGNTDLTVYFGRCLGGVALAVILTVVRYIPDPKSQPALFDLIALVGAAMVVVHVWGALRKAQPISETVEIVFYAAVGVAAAWIRFSVLA